MTQRHEEQKRERRRAERDEKRNALVADQAAAVLASKMPASHHTEQLAECESIARGLIAHINAGYSDTWSERADLIWYRDRIQGHAIRAIVAMLRELLS